MGSITETATSAPGYSSLRPNTKAPLAMTLKLNGYSTAQFGKCHEVPPWQTSPIGPFDAWPSGGGGFEYFYGFIGGENNQWYPALYDGTTPVEPETTPEEGYHLTEDLADRAIDWVRTQKALVPDKPFFMYFAPGATHAPHHVPQEWADRYAGQFADGWDAQRERTFARQKELGVIAADAELTPRPGRDPGVGRHGRRAQAGAGAADGGVRRASWSTPTTTSAGVIDAIETIGASRRTRSSTTSSATTARRPRARSTARSTRWPTSTGWPRSRRPSSWRRRWTSSARRTRTTTTRSVGRGRCDTPVPVDQAGGLALGRHPQRHHRALARRHHRARAGSARSSRHVIDVAPTILEAAGLPEPDDRQRRAAVAHRGHEHAVHASTTPTPPERHDLQYFEMFGNRGIYYKGWSAVTKHRTPWLPTEVLPAFDDDVWELYDGTTDWTQADDLAAEDAREAARSCSGSG